MFLSLSHVVGYLILSIPDLCRFSYLHLPSSMGLQTNKKKHVIIFVTKTCFWPGYGHIYTGTYDQACPVSRVYFAIGFLLKSIVHGLVFQIAHLYRGTLDY